MLAGSLLAPVAAAGQAAAPGPIAYPVRFATHATPGPGTAPRDADLVVGVVVGGEARAYPVNLLWGESAHTVNDDLGRAPIAVALCPLAGVATAFDRRRGKEVLEIGHVSEVRLDTLVMYDARTRSRWGLLTGEAFEGPLAGQKLSRLPSLFTTWGRWKALHPGTTVYVAPEEAARGFELDEARIRRVLLAGAGPPRRGDWVVGIEGRASSAAFLLRALARVRVANDVLEDRPIVVFVTSDLTTTLVWSRERRRAHADLRGGRGPHDRRGDALVVGRLDGDRPCPGPSRAARSPRCRPPRASGTRGRPTTPTRR